MKKKLSVRAAVSLLLSALLFCMPAGAFMANSGNTVDAYAEESGASEEGSTEAETEGNKETGETEAESGENEGETESGDSEEGTEGGTVSGNEVPEPECTCKENAHSIPLIKIVRSARGITAYVNM